MKQERVAFVFQPIRRIVGIDIDIVSVNHVSKIRR